MPATDRARRYDATLFGIALRRSLLDDERPLRHLDDERGVVEVAPRAALESGQRRASKTFPLKRTECPPAPSGSQ